MESNGKKFIICKASAGAGKTFTLVKEYLVQAFDARDDRELADRFRRILAITFTNKAAGEMKERIMGDLAQMASDPEKSPMAHEVADEMGISLAETSRRAEIVRNAILHSYSDLSVCTIDSFMHRIVRTFAHDLGLPMNFEVMVDQEALVTDTVAELLARTGTEGSEALTEVLRRFAESRMEEGKSYEIETDLKKLASDLLKEDSQLRVEALKNLSLNDFCEIDREYNRQNRAFEERAKNVGRRILDAVADRGLSDDDFFHKSTGVMGFFRKMADGNFALPGAFAVAAIEQDKRTAAKCPPATADAIDAVWPQIVEAYNEGCALMDSELRSYNTRRALQKNLFAMAVMGQLQAIGKQYSQDNEIVHISEFNKQIFDIVQNEPAPFIYERLGGRYKNFLIDEFQDTSRLQWQDLVPLIENGVADGHRSLVVGDGKQAIYRFRQGDVKQFVDLPRVDSPLHGRLLASAGTYDFIYRLQNRRTGRTIVDFNNDFFSWAVRNCFAENTDMQRIYVGTDADGNLNPAGREELRQEAVRDGGYVELNFAAAEKAHTEALASVEKAIRDAVSDGFALRDITVIARDKATLSMVSDHLSTCTDPIKVASTESFLLKNSELVMTVIALLRHLATPDDRVAAAEVIERLALMGLSDLPDETLFDEKSIDVKAFMNRNGMGFEPDRLRAMSLYDCCEELLRLVGRDGFESAYAATFLSVVAGYTASHRQDLGEFLEWFDQQKSKLSTGTSDDLDAVCLMTIHKAKGLESKVIVYPILNRREQTDEIWVDVSDSDLRLPVGLVSGSKSISTDFDPQRDAEVEKCEIDDMNILYVALTRSRDRLYIVSEEASRTDTTSYRALLRDYAQIGGGRQIGDRCFSWGSRVPAPESDHADSGVVKLGRVSFPDWSGRIAIASQSERTMTPLMEERIRLGLRTHAALALVTTADNVSEAIKRYSVAENLDEAESKALQTEIEAIVAAPNCKVFFDPRWQVRNECDLVFRGEVMRPDRVLTDGDEAWVVDYKTGSPLPQHRTQVTGYCQALRAMGFRTVRGFVLYTADRQAVEI